MPILMTKNYETPEIIRCLITGVCWTKCRDCNDITEQKGQTTEFEKLKESKAGKPHGLRCDRQANS